MSTSVETEDEVLEDYLQRMNRLQAIYKAGHLTEEEFETRKSNIIDELTGTSSTYKSAHRQSTNTLHTLSRSRKYSHRHGSEHMHIKSFEPKQTRRKSTPKASKHKRVSVEPHDPPDWSKKRSEKAIKHTYSYVDNEWTEEVCKVKIDPVPFDSGGLRDVFYLQDLSDKSEQWVAKRSQDTRDNRTREIYFRDVRMQAIAKFFCWGDDNTKGYNSYEPPKEVDFLDAYVLQLIQREGSPLCHVEKYISGPYRKHNNNAGWVSDNERNTPQAFAHFTYEASKRKLLVCDIQGVDDLYTDPQVHTLENKVAFGRGNQGEKGIADFLSTHRCNAVCKYLQLPNVSGLPIAVAGTLPAATVMAHQQINTVAFNANEDWSTPLLSDGTLPAFKEDTGCCAWCCIL